MQKSLKIIHKILDNIIWNPDNDKFQKVRLNNPKIKAAISDIEQARFLFEMLEFELIKSYFTDKETGISTHEEYYLLSKDKSDWRQMIILNDILKEITTK